MNSPSGDGYITAGIYTADESVFAFEWVKRNSPPAVITAGGGGVTGVSAAAGVKLRNVVDRRITR